MVARVASLTLRVVALLNRFLSGRAPACCGLADQWRHGVPSLLHEMKWRTFSQGELKGTELRWQREPKKQIFAENRRFSQIHPFSWKFQHLEGAGNRRKPQIFAGNRRFFAENRRKPQIGLCYPRCVTFSSALFSQCPINQKNSTVRRKLPTGSKSATSLVLWHCSCRRQPGCHHPGQAGTFLRISSWQAPITRSVLWSAYIN